MTFYLGTHKPWWLWSAAFRDIPLCLSRNELVKRQSFKPALTTWVVDSGAFTVLKDHGKFTESAAIYAGRVACWQEKIGNLKWASIQDWMCEPFMLARTGHTIVDHQRLTIASYWDLTSLAPNVPWMPVLQGWEAEDYLAHLAMWRDSGYAGKAFGLGSVCRRQNTSGIRELVASLILDDPELKLHGFGVKTSGLSDFGSLLNSADSFAWSLDARLTRPLPECSHGRDGCGTCANCPRYALWWRKRMLARSYRAPLQESLFAT